MRVELDEPQEAEEIKVDMPAGLVFNPINIFMAHENPKALVSEFLENS